MTYTQIFLELQDLLLPVCFEMWCNDEEMVHLDENAITVRSQVDV